MQNFLQETKNVIRDSGHTVDDVMFIGSRDGEYRLKFDEFSKLADFEYDSGYGGQVIALDMIVYFYDKSYIVRGEYDGSEWWEYRTPLDYHDTDTHKPFSNMQGCWDTIKRLNEGDN